MKTNHGKAAFIPYLLRWVVEGFSLAVRGFVPGSEHRISIANDSSWRCDQVKEKPTFREALKFWTKLGFISFGGPAGQIAIMHEYLVEIRNGLATAAFCTLLITV